LKKTVYERSGKNGFSISGFRGNVEGAVRVLINQITDLAGECGNYPPIM
jgi:hypothetical protein